MNEKNWIRDYGLILVTGVAVGIAALGLTASGNPKNMGFCIACFLRDIAGALGLHSSGGADQAMPQSEVMRRGTEISLPSSPRRRQSCSVAMAPAVV